MKEKNTPETIEFKKWVENIRTDFHQHPELSGQETRTTQKILEILRDLGIQAHGFDDATGVVGLIQGKNPGPCLAIRADIDALPIEEVHGRPHGSKNPGLMHACGHDGHTAILLGLAKKIIDTGLAKKIRGSVKLIFQPSEEKLGGSLMMIDHGVLDNPKVDRIIAGHMDPNFPAGQVGVFTRIGHAASLPFTLTINGKGAHGARPHMGINPITVAGVIATGIDGLIQRQVPPTQSGVISLGSFQSGQAGNVIPKTAELKGSIRTHDPEAEVNLKQALKDLAKGTCAVFNAGHTLEFGNGAPLGLNDPEACLSLERASISVVGKENVHALPSIMGSDDFYFFTQKCPGAMMRFGCANEKEGITHPLHSPEFDLHSSALTVGTDILFAAVKEYFEQS